MGQLWTSGSRIFIFFFYIFCPTLLIQGRHIINTLVATRKDVNVSVEIIEYNLLLDNPIVITHSGLGHVTIRTPPSNYTTTGAPGSRLNPYLQCDY